VLADLHVGSPFTNSLKPDLIVIPGDFVIHGVRGGMRFRVPPEVTLLVLHPNKG